MKFVIALALVVLCIVVPQCSAGLSSGDVIIEPIPFEMGIFEKIMNRLFYPYTKKITARFQRVIDAVKNKASNLSEIIKDEINNLFDLTKNQVIRIVMVVHYVGVDVNVLLNRMTSSLVKLINTIGEINTETKNILLQIVDNYIEKLQEVIRERIGDDKIENQAYGFDLGEKFREYVVRPIFSAVIGILENHPELKEKINKAGDKLKAELDELATLLKPRLDRIVSLLKNLGADVKKIGESIKSTLTSLIDNLNTIAEENKAAIKQLLHRFVDKLLDLVAPEEKVEPFASDNYLILDKIYERFVQPLVQKIKESVEKIMKLLEEKSQNARENIEEDIEELLRLLKPRVERIIEVVKKFGGNVDELRERIRETARKVIDNLQDVSDDSRQAMRDIVNRFLNKLLGKMDPQVESFLIM